MSFEHNLHRPHAGLSEHKLLIALLRDAIACWQDGVLRFPPGTYCASSQRARWYSEADRWIFSRYDNYPFYSFCDVCTYLGIQPDFIRRRLLDWQSNVCTARRHPVRDLDLA